MSFDLTGYGYLFVPGDSGHKIKKAFGTRARAVILDLEDGVAFGSKEEARQTILSTVNQLPPDVRKSKRLVLRCNPFGSPYFAGDLEMASNLQVDALMLPKCEDQSAIHATLAVLPEVDILPLIESARGIVRLEQIVRAGGKVPRVAFGAVDFALDLGVDWTPEGDERKQAMGQLVLMSRTLDLAPPLGAVFPITDDQAAFQADARFEKKIGFYEKMTIHPRQIEWLAEIYEVSQEKRDWNLKVVEAFEAAGSGAIQLDGYLIDLPVYLKSKRLLQGVKQNEPTPHS